MRVSKNPSFIRPKEQVHHREQDKKQDPNNVETEADRFE